ncbi:galactose mutarotase [Caballeronia sp. LZ062]|uniref:aldose epimerase family protein n=1 Tax=unclassified Caballeronia TaxID=2646786 RepID=UPI0028606B46|nr:MULTISPECIES: aldose epimerase family protein [unclassified Caballeronia]MDR5856092.1 galactose mutarotase [Caballeronia sp. LZ050]MDR5872763.1 galactose mutarotase [Caballeronia sp. LZ062]
MTLFPRTLVALCAAMLPFAASAATITSSPYGATQQGQPVVQYTLANARGVSMSCMTYGGIVTRIDVPDRHGRRADIVLGFASLGDYERYNGAIHFGSLIGRYANRIAQGRFTLDGHTYQLPINDPPNTLHSGPHSFDEKVWTVVRTFQNASGAGVQLRYVSPDNENGFPGTLTVDVTYTLTDDNEVRIDYRAKTDKPTVVNLTNHSYFNLAGEGSGSVENQLIMIAASSYTPTRSDSIPTGEVASVEGTPLDLRALTPIGARLRSGFAQLHYARGYDNNFKLNKSSQHEGEPSFAARAYDPASGRVLDVYTTQPGLQFYSANGLDGSAVGVSGVAYRQTDAFALEAEHFPDSPNHPSFPSTELRPGDEYHEVTVWKFGVR